MDRATLYGEAAQALRDLAKAERDSLKLCAQRAKMPLSSTRAKTTTAEARWARAAEDRDRKLRRAVDAIARAGLNDPPELRTAEHYEIGSGGHVPR